MSHYFVALVLVLISAGASAYQVTGPVVEVTNTKIVIQKNNEYYEISRNRDTRGDFNVSVGDQVTVQYRMSSTPSASAQNVRSYQVSGTVLEVNDSKIVLQKNWDKFEISGNSPDNKTLRLGDQAVILYWLMASEIAVASSTVAASPNDPCNAVKAEQSQQSSLRNQIANERNPIRRDVLNAQLAQSESATHAALANMVQTN